MDERYTGNSEGPPLVVKESGAFVEEIDVFYSCVMIQVVFRRRARKDSICPHICLIKQPFFGKLVGANIIVQKRTPVHAIAKDIFDVGEVVIIDIHDRVDINLFLLPMGFLHRAKII